MTILRFEADLPEYAFTTLALPVEVRKLNMALVTRTLASQSVEIDPGIYYVTAKLPNGRRLFGQSDIAGEFAKIVLRPEPEEDDTQLFPLNDTAFHSEFMGDFFSLSTRASSLDLHEPGRPARPQFQLRRFVGNVLGGDFSAVEEDELDQLRPTSFEPLRVEGSVHNTLIQLLQPDLPPLNVVLPIYLGEQCEVSLRPSSGGRITFAVRLTHPETDLLLQYLENGYLQQAATLVNAEALNTRDLLANRYLSAVAIKLYTQLRLGELDELSDLFGRLGPWPGGLVFFPNRFPDESAIRGEVLARLGRHEEALEAFCELPKLGLPFFGDGLSYAVARLKLYYRCGQGSFNTRAFSQVASTLSSLQKFAAHTGTSHPLFTYMGVHVAEPDRSPLPRDWVTQLPVAETPGRGFMAVDLGNTKSIVAVMDGGEPNIISDQFGNRAMPSIVAFLSSGEQLVGSSAKRQYITNASNTIDSIKRLVGRRFDEVSKRTNRISLDLQPGPNGEIRLRVAGTLWSPEEILAIILRELKHFAEEHCGWEITRAVITVPAFYDSAQREATKNAGRIAGLEEIHLLNEPTAAALAYGINKKSPETIAVFDFGGGSFDVSILNVGNDRVEVRSTHGDPDLGGVDIDERIVEWLTEEFKRDQGIDLSTDAVALQRLREAAERAKIDLSSTMETEINLPFIVAGQSGPKHLLMRLTRSEFEQLIDPILKRLIPPIEQAIEEANVDAKDIDEILLVGESTRIPKVQDIVKSLFGREPNKSVDPDEVVVIGAAVHAGVLAREAADIVLLDIMPLSLGIETLGGVFTKLIERNTTIPTQKSEIFSTASDNQASVEVHVLQGERPMAADNRSLGRFHLVGIRPAPRGMPQIEVTFDIDANGVANVSAKDLATGRKQKVTITSSSGLGKDEIDRMMREANSRAAQDARKLNEIEARNRLDGMIYQVEKMLNENRQNLRVIDSEIQSAITDGKRAIEQGEVERINDAFEVLQSVSHKMAERLYQQQDFTGTEMAATAESSQGEAEVELEAELDENA